MPTEKTIALAPPGVPHCREEQMVAGEEAAFERPRDLRAAHALAPAHRHLDDPVPAPNRLDHHPRGPAAGLLPPARAPAPRGRAPPARTGGRQPGAVER